MCTLAHGSLPRNSTLCLSFEEIPQDIAFVVRPKPESSGFEVAANLDFKGKMSTVFQTLAQASF